MVVYMFVFHALGFLPSTLRQDSRHRVMWILSLVVHHLVPSPMVLVYPVGSEHPMGGKLRMVLETFGVEKNLSYLDEVTQKSPKTTCVVGFLVVTFHLMMIQNPQLKKTWWNSSKNISKKSIVGVGLPGVYFLKAEVKPVWVEFCWKFQSMDHLAILPETNSKFAPENWCLEDEPSVSHTIYVWYIYFFSTFGYDLYGFQIKACQKSIKHAKNIKYHEPAKSHEEHKFSMYIWFRPILQGRTVSVTSGT